jgi:Uma2 family endonuclease
MAAPTIQIENIQTQPLCTPEEYLELEKKADFRSEYDDGIITPMTGGTTDHNRISLNCSIALSLGLKGQSCEVFMAGVKVWIANSRSFKYPDVMVVLGEPDYVWPASGYDRQSSRHH